MDNKVDLYLWKIPDNNILYKLGNISMLQANELSVQWFAASEVNDYMIAIIGSTPWSDPKPKIIDISEEWIMDEIKKVVTPS